MTYKQVKERETFWQHKLRNVYPAGLNERESTYIIART